MEKTINKPRKSGVDVTSRSKATKKIITEEDIRNRAFELYLKNKNSSSTEQDNWLYAERELSGFHK
jgi:hypothetical protein